MINCHLLCLYICFSNIYLTASTIITSVTLANSAIDVCVDIITHLHSYEVVYYS